MLSELMVAVFLIHVQFISKATCFVNLAHIPMQGLQGNATMNVSPYVEMWNAHRAVDGDTNQLYLDNSCVVTNLQSEPLWWKVWLHRTFNIAYLEIYFRSDTYRRSTGFYIYSYYDEPFTPPDGATGSLVYHHDPMSGCPNSVMNITVNRVARGIAFYNERPPGFTSSCSDIDTNQIEVGICEVKVMGCDAARYHPGCTNVCPYQCKNRHCDAFNGSCIYGCSSPTAVTTDCTECPVNTYVLIGRCVACGYCKNDSPCNRTTGRCNNGCDNQWIGDTCKLCTPGFYGSDCDQQCWKCKLGTVCHNETGDCPQGCQENWTGARCNVCPVTHYVLNGNCIPCGHCKDSMPCNRTTGRCDNGCKNHWVEDTCKLCRPGYYGGDCEKQCGKCKSGAACHNDTGYCPRGCLENWTGIRCDECRNGVYGENCTSTCGKCTKSTFCDKKNGTCTEGCQEQWTDPLCDVCPVNHYVLNENCIPCGHCKDNMSCNRTTGRCDNGCSIQWIGDACKSCRPGFFGGNCNQPCGKCKSETACHNLTGMCLYGCQENWNVPKCDVCSPYKYGPNCAFDCGHCKDGRPCSTGNGTCLNGCEEGWRGITCLTASSTSDSQGFSNRDKSSPTGLYVIIGVLSTLLVIIVLVVTILAHIIRKQRREPSQQYEASSPPSFINHIEIEETHHYDKLGVTDVNDYQELPPVVTDQHS